MKHFNKLTPAEAERLALVAEECAEVIQAVGKILRHGYESRFPAGGPTNREQLETELGHVDCAQHMLIGAADVRGLAISYSAREKQHKIGRYLHHAGAPKAL